jgi:TetR/AcrR family transcriptional regulator, transcriptional repressor for nem operon
MAELSKRRDIVDATKQLLWTVGYESMSPRDVLAASGAGQGSLYHHFATKKDLAKFAMSEIYSEMQLDLKRNFNSLFPPMQRMRNYLIADRSGLMGCRLGRLANESAFSDDELRKSLQNYFEAVTDVLSTTLLEAQCDGVLPSNINCRELAVTIAATVQGGYVLSRATKDSNAVNIATAGAYALIEALGLRRP